MSDPLAQSASSATIAQSYDSVAYPAQPIAFAHPTHIGGIARLFGLAPRAMVGARVLEIGCADGGNLVPMACAFPDTGFFGLELSAQQAERGAAMAADYGLSNLQVLQGDIAAPPAALAGNFDFIICHGVFSWVAAETQQQLLRFCHDRLNPGGVVYLSYNVYPGWKLREVLRDMMLHHAGGIDEPARRIEQARAILGFTANLSRADSPYGQMLRQEHAALSAQPDHYVFHEMLAPHNRPLPFREVMALAGACGLGYVGDVNLASMTPQGVAADGLAKLQELCAGDQELLEQHLDFINNRAFRTSVLARRADMGSLDRALPMQALDDLRIAPACMPAGRKPGQPQVRLFRDGMGNTAEISDAALLVFMDRLIEQGLPWRSFGQWCGELAAIGGLRREPFAEAFYKQFMPLLFGNLVHLHHDSPQPARRDGVLRAFEPARRAARAGAVRVVAKSHVMIEVGPPEALLLSMADGSATPQGIADEIAARATDGRLPIRFQAKRAQTPEGLRAEARRLVDMTIDRFDAMGLLDGR
jgi:SAM-dependent methyltransferase